jgi:hypothetical protein
MPTLKGFDTFGQGWLPPSTKLNLGYPLLVHGRINTERLGSAYDASRLPSTIAYVEHDQAHTHDLGNEAEGRQ